MREKTGNDNEPPTKAAGVSHSNGSLAATVQKTAWDTVVMIKTVRAPRRSTRCPRRGAPHAIPRATAAATSPASAKLWCKPRTTLRVNAMGAAVTGMRATSANQYRDLTPGTLKTRV